MRTIAVYGENAREAISLEQWDEVVKLARMAVAERSKGPGDEGYIARLEACAELLAEIGVIHNTPNGKRDWIEGRE